MSIKKTNHLVLKTAFNTTATEVEKVFNINNSFTKSKLNSKAA